MAFIYAESLIELAIRIGIDDLAADPAALATLLGIDACRDAGMDLTPDGQAEKVFDPTLLDEFQQKLEQLRRVKGEEGKRSVFKNTIPEVPDLQDYLSRANVRFIHGYPREAEDLPAVAITLGGETEGQKYAGQHKLTPIGQKGDGSLTWRLGSDMEADYHIHILTPNYDETVFLFHLIKYGLLKYRDHLEGYGIREATMHWQAAEPAPEYLQGGLFVYQRTCVLSCVKDESFDYTKKAGLYTDLNYNLATTDAPDDVIIAREVVPPGPPEGALP